MGKDNEGQEAAQLPEKVETQPIVEAGTVHPENIFAMPAKQFDGALALYDRNRKAFLKWATGELKEKIHFNIIKGKKSLGKAGAEEVANRLRVDSAVIELDHETFEMLGKPDGVVFYRCTMSRGGYVVAIGRGARNIKQDNGDYNKTIKMAQKSAYVDAAIRLGGLSEFYTQDIEDMKKEDISASDEETEMLKRAYHHIGDQLKEAASRADEAYAIKLLEEEGFSAMPNVKAALKSGKLSIEDAMALGDRIKEKLEQA